MGLTLPPDDPRNPKKKKKSNLADGRTSYDSESTGSIVEFFNRNVSPYPVSVGGPAFDLIPVEKQKDIMVNVARMHGHQEYNRIMELVTVLQRQADDVRKRLEITDLVHAAKYSFQIYHGQCYWGWRLTTDMVAPSWSKLVQQNGQPPCPSITSMFAV